MVRTTKAASGIAGSRVDEQIKAALKEMTPTQMAFGLVFIMGVVFGISLKNKKYDSKKAKARQRASARKSKTQAPQKAN